MRSSGLLVVAGLGPATAVAGGAGDGPLLLAALAGIAAVGLIAGTLLLARRRARRDASSATSLTDETAAIITRRTLRRSRIRVLHDPILAVHGEETGKDDRRRFRRRRGRSSEPPRTETPASD